MKFLRFWGANAKKGKKHANKGKSKRQTRKSAGQVPSKSSSKNLSGEEICASVAFVLEETIVLHTVREDSGEHSFWKDHTYLCIRDVFDSQLLRAGYVKTVFLELEADRFLVVAVKPDSLLPSYRSFSEILTMANSSGWITYAGLRFLVINRDSLESYLPQDSHVVGVSRGREPKDVYFKRGFHYVPKDVYFKRGLHSRTEKPVNLTQYIRNINNRSIVFRVGLWDEDEEADIELLKTSRFVSVSQYVLSPECCVRKICHAMERVYT